MSGGLAEGVRGEMDRGETPRTRPAARRLSHGVRGDLVCGLGSRAKAGRLRSPLGDLGDGPGGVFGDEGVGIDGGLWGVREVGG